MARGGPKTSNTIRQIYSINGGEFDVKMTTNHPLSSGELEEYGKVVAVVESYVEKWPPESAPVAELRGGKSKQQQGTAG